MPESPINTFWSSVGTTSGELARTVLGATASPGHNTDSGTQLGRARLCAVARDKDVIMSRTLPPAGSDQSDERIGVIQRRIDEIIAAAVEDPDHAEALLGEALAELQRRVIQLQDVACGSLPGAERQASVSAPDGGRARSQSDLLLEAILDGTPFVMLLLDGDQRVRQVNRAGAAFAECSPDEVVGARVGAALRCVGSLDDPRGCGLGPVCEGCVVGKIVSDTLANRQAYVGVRAALPLARPSGFEEVRLLVSSTPVELGDESMALVCLEDITEQERSAETLRAIADYTYDWESWFAPDGRLMWVNPAVEKLTGYSPEDCREMSDYPLSIVHEADRAAFGARFRKAVAERRPINDLPFRVSCKDGSVCWMAVSWQPICDGRGDHIGLRTSVRDITERKRAEEERLTHLHFFESMDRINRAIQTSNDLQQMMSDVLDVVLSVFGCDRACLVYPCGPEEATWRAPMERARPEYPGVLLLSLEVPFDPDVVRVHKQVLESDDPVGFGPGNEHALPADVAEQFNLQSQLAMAVYPKVDKPYMFVIHQCSRPRAWTPEERRLLKEIGRRLADGLTTLLMFRNLRESESRLAEAQRIAKIGNWVWDVTNNELWWSDETFRIFDIRREEFGATLGAFLNSVHLDDRERVQSSIGQPLQHGLGTWQIDYRIARADGTIRFVHEEAETEFDLDGKPLRRLGTVQDVTERKLAEEALRESEERFRGLVTQAADAFFLLDWDGRILDVNQSACDGLGYGRDELLAMNIADVDVKVEGHRHKEQFWDALRPGEPATFEGVHHRKDGSTFPVEVRLGVLELGGSKLMLGLARDISDRKKAAEEKRQLAAQLYQAQKMEAIGQLAGGVAHDFNNLLTVITGNAELIESTLAENASAWPSLERIMEAAQQASGVTRSLLTFSSRIPIEMERIELRGVAQKTMHLLRRMIPAAISLVTDPPGRPPVWLSADRTQLQQVIMNLAVNARDAMPEGGTLRIGVAELSGEAAKAALPDLGAAELATDRVAQMIVSDTGVGMSPEVKDRVFEPFFTTKPREQGTGLGLAIVHGIVKEHGGCIEIDSVPGEGTTFKITLPVLEANTSDGFAEEHALSESRIQGELVLLAEDNWNVRSVFATVLKKSGFQVLEASDGVSLMARFAERLGDIGLLILDVDLPKRSGLDCLREIRDRGVITPAIVVTGGTKTAAEHDLDRYTVLLRKPFRTAKLQRLAIDLISDCYQLETK